MTNEEKMALDRHTEALEAHTRALNSLTAILCGIFDNNSTLNPKKTVKPLDKPLEGFIESLEQVTSRNHLIAQTNWDASEKMARAANVAYDAALVNDSAANKISSVK